MRTKPVEGVLRLDVNDLVPRPEMCLTYDGLSGISQRPMLRDLMDEFERSGEKATAEFLDAMRRARSGYVSVYFMDYVSYGIGGGDAAAEFFLGRFILLHEPARPDAPEHLALIRPGGTERLAVSESPRTVNPTGSD